MARGERLPLPADPVRRPPPAHAQCTTCLLTSRRRGPVLHESHPSVERFEPGLDDVKDRREREFSEL